MRRPVDLYGRRRRGELSANIATPNPSPLISPSTTNGHGEIPVSTQYASAIATPSRLVARSAASVSSTSGFNVTQELYYFTRLMKKRNPLTLRRAQHERIPLVLSLSKGFSSACQAANE